jgi:predicted nucleotidyltransferase
MNQNILREIQALKRQLLPNERVVLFGSQARGDAHEGSDWDLLVLLNKKKRDFSVDYDNYAYPFAEIGLKYNTPISIQLFTIYDWERQKHSIFYKNIEQEGVDIV